MVSIGPLGPFPYTIHIGSEPTYPRLGGRKGGPRCTQLIIVPLLIHPYISNLLDDTSNGLWPVVLLILPLLSHHLLDPIDLYHEKLSPVHGVVPLPLGFPKPLPNIPLLPQR